MTFSRSIWSELANDQSGELYEDIFKAFPSWDWTRESPGRPQPPKFSNGVGTDLSMWSNIRGGSFSHVTKSQTSSIAKIYRPELF